MNKEITLQRDTFWKENGRITYSTFFLPKEVATVKEVRRKSSNRRITDYLDDSGKVEFRGNCDEIICKVWWEEERDEFKEHMFFLKMVKEGRLDPFDKHKKGFRKKLLKMMKEYD